MIEHASESGHWYDKLGNPRYTIVGKNGKERPTTLRDARKENWVPGATVIIKCAAAPGLQAWIIEQHMLACLTTERVDGETEKDFIARIKRDANEHAKKAADRGTTIHVWVQGGFEGEKLSAEGERFYLSALEELETIVGKQQWICEKPFATDKYGGKVDLHNDKYLIDIKTTDKDISTLKTWHEQHMQLAAYSHGLGGPERQCFILYINTLTADALLLPVEQDEITTGLKCFNALVEYWRAKNKVE